MRRVLVGLMGLALAAAVVSAQTRPTANTEVYLTRLAVGRMPLADSPLTNVSNNPGYDNQPSFTPDGKGVLFTSNRDGKQTDIYRYDLTTKALIQLTHSPESEYSPVVTPDGKTFSVIRVEADNTQRLWRFDLDGSNPRRVMTQVTGVGYQAWLDATHVAVFIVGANGQKNTLQLADTATDSAELIDSDPGHGLALHRTGGTVSVTYVCKSDAAQWVVKEFSLADKKPVVLGPAVAKSEDLAWDGADRLYMPSGPKILFRTATSPDWKEAGDFSAAGIDHITRLAILPPGRGGTSPPMLALVAEPVAR